MWCHIRSWRLGCVCRSSSWTFRCSLSFLLRRRLALRSWCLYWFLPGYGAGTSTCRRPGRRPSRLQSSRGFDSPDWFFRTSGWSFLRPCRCSLCCNGFVDISVLTTSNGDCEESGSAAFYFTGLIGSEVVLAHLGQDWSIQVVFSVMILGMTQRQDVIGPVPLTRHQVLHRRREMHSRSHRCLPRAQFLHSDW